MPEKILGCEVFTEDELIERINKEIKSDSRPKISKKMIAYLRDVVGVIPKAIHMRTSERGGAKACYTREALQAALFAIKENWHNKKTLKEIREQHKDFFKDARQKTDLFRQKFDAYQTFIKHDGGDINQHDDIHVTGFVRLEIVPADAPNLPSRIDEVDKNLKADLEKALDVLKSGHYDEKVLDGLLDQIYLQYQERLKCQAERHSRKGVRE